MLFSLELKSNRMSSWSEVVELSSSIAQLEITGVTGGEDNVERETGGVRIQGGEGA